MQGKEKRDPLIRTFVVIIVGTIAFSLLFELFRGGSSMNMGNMGQMGTASGIFGSSLDSFLAGILLLAVKLLIVVLVAAIFVAIGMWIKKTFFKDTKFSFGQTINNDPILKTAVFAVAGILGIILLLSLLGSFTGSSMGYGMNSGMGNYSTALSVSGLLTLLVKVLSFVLVVSLIMALVAYIKKLYDERNTVAGKTENQVKQTEEPTITQSKTDSSSQM